MDDNKDNHDDIVGKRLADLRHDLKNPVGQIIGYSEMIEEDIEGEQGVTELFADLENVRKAGERLLEQINSTLGKTTSSGKEIDPAFAQYQLRLQLNEVTGYAEILEETSIETGREELLPDLHKIGTASRNFLDILESRLTSELLEATDGGVSLETETVTSEVRGDEAVPSTKDDTGLGDHGDILVIDDDPGNREMLKRRLEKQGYKVEVAENGRDALTSLENVHKDLILLDLNMPGMNGQEVLKQLKNDVRLRHIPVIMLSAADEADTIVRCVMLGAEDYLSKPFNPVILKARISASLEKYRLRRERTPRLRIFVSSPTDVNEERQVVRDLIQRLNQELTGQVYLVPMFWEDEPLRASETFQTQLDFPADSDIFIGIFWSRLGQPLPGHIKRKDGTQYLSGSEFEFEDAMEGFRANGKPDICIYRKTAVQSVPLTDRDTLMSMMEQKERVEEFIHKWFFDKDGTFKGAFHAFETTSQFEKLLEAHLRKLVLSKIPD